MTIIAIDPGASGGIAVFNKGRAQAVRMPKDVKKMQEYFRFLIKTYASPTNNLMVFIEKVNAYRGDHDDNPGKMFGINKMLANYSQILTVIQLSNIQFIEVYPISWQSKLGLIWRKEKLTKTERKNRFKTYAANCFPEIQKMTMAICDALCIIQFALVKLKDDQLWIDDHLQNKQRNYNLPLN